MECARVLTREERLFQTRVRCFQRLFTYVFFIETSKCDIKTIELLELYNLYITNRLKKKIDGLKK